MAARAAETKLNWFSSIVESKEWTAVKKLLLNTDGRDKLTKAGQYGTRLLLWALTQAHPPASVPKALLLFPLLPSAQRKGLEDWLKSISGTFSAGRKLIRLFKWTYSLPNIAKTIREWQGNFDDYARLYMYVVGGVTDLLDDLAKYCQYGVLSTRFQATYSQYSTYCWFWSLLAELYFGHKSFRKAHGELTLLQAEKQDVLDTIKSTLIELYDLTKDKWKRKESKSKSRSPEQEQDSPRQLETQDSPATVDRTDTPSSEQLTRILSTRLDQLLANSLLDEEELEGIVEDTEEDDSKRLPSSPGKAAPLGTDSDLTAHSSSQQMGRYSRCGRSVKTRVLGCVQRITRLMMRRQSINKEMPAVAERYMLARNQVFKLWCDFGVVFPDVFISNYSPGARLTAGLASACLSLFAIYTKGLH